jgi:ribosome biogenesis GTPase A
MSRVILSQKKSGSLKAVNAFAGFLPRESFNYDPDVKWFPHHMAKAKIAIPKKLPIVDLLVEVRDSRLPLTSAQFELESCVRLRPGKQRIVVLNKQDLVPKSVSRESVSLLELRGTPVLATSALNHSNVSEVVSFITENVRVKFKSLGIVVMVTGLPNTGKSTLLNAMRSLCPHPVEDKAPAKTSGIPGSTNAIGKIQISSHSPKIFVLDTPGVMITKSGIEDEEDAADIMMKLAAVGAMPDTVPGITAVADYILYKLNKGGMFKYVDIFSLTKGPSNDIDEVIDGAARSINNGTNRIDYHAGTLKFIHSFREGKLGKMCLDEIKEIDQVVNQLENETVFKFRTEPPGPWGPSRYPVDTSLTRAIYSNSSAKKAS